MYYFKLTQSTCILNTGILIAWFINNFGSIGERQVRYMLSNNRKKLILIGISRKLFTHSLPLVVAESCYIKLLKDARNLIVDTKILRKKEKAYSLLINIIEEYNLRVLLTNIYWD